MTLSEQDSYMLTPRTIRHNQTSLTLYPDRWGIITSMKIWDTELLYQGMLEDTLHDITKSVRWGIPILFPNAGFLTDEEKGVSWWNLPQHGFARTNEWKISESHHPRGRKNPVFCHAEEWGICSGSKQETDSSFVGMTKNDNILTQSLSSIDIPDMFGYDWQGSIENTITLSDRWVELGYSIANNSNKELPISFGLHPYWNIPLGDKSLIEWNFAWGDIIARDIDTWSRGGTTRIDTPDDGIVSFTISWVGTIELQLSSEFRRLWIWSLQGRDFVCVEPVMWDDGNIMRIPVKIPRGGKSESWVKVILK